MCSILNLLKKKVYGISKWMTYDIFFNTMLDDHTILNKNAWNFIYTIEIMFQRLPVYYMEWMVLYDYLV